jgi:NAD(P)-dependent dehydrogenase (short-subunit alcohol dehydrogenase family)
MANVLITGTSKGIGLSSALTLARAGHTVYATMRSADRAAELAEEAAQEGLPIHYSVMDVDSDESVSSGTAAIGEAAGVIDVLVNNAGVERNGSIEELPMADFRAVMETNYFGAALHQGRDSAHAPAAQWLHHQRHFGSRAGFHFAARPLCCYEIRA